MESADKNSERDDYQRKIREEVMRRIQQKRKE